MYRWLIFKLLYINSESAIIVAFNIFIIPFNKFSWVNVYIVFFSTYKIVLHIG